MTNTPRALLIEDYREKCAKMEDDMLGWKESAQAPSTKPVAESAGAICSRCQSLERELAGCQQALETTTQQYNELNTSFRRTCGELAEALKRIPVTQPDRAEADEDGIRAVPTPTEAAMCEARDIIMACVGSVCSDGNSDAGSVADAILTALSSAGLAVVPVERQLPSVEFLRQQLEYDPETGIVTNKVHRGPGARPRNPTGGGEMTSDNDAVKKALAALGAEMDAKMSDALLGDISPLGVRR